MKTRMRNLLIVVTLGVLCFANYVCADDSLQANNSGTTPASDALSLSEDMLPLIAFEQGINIGKAVAAFRHTHPQPANLPILMQLVINEASEFWTSKNIYNSFSNGCTLGYVTSTITFAEHQQPTALYAGTSPAATTFSAAVTPAGNPTATDGNNNSVQLVTFPLNDSNLMGKLAAAQGNIQGSMFATILFINAQVDLSIVPPILSLREIQTFAFWNNLNLQEKYLTSWGIGFLNSYNALCASAILPGSDAEATNSALSTAPSSIEMLKGASPDEIRDKVLILFQSNQQQ